MILNIIYLLSSQGKTGPIPELVIVDFLNNKLSLFK